MIPAMRRAARILSVALITAGIVILADAAVTLAWKEPLSAVYGSLQQSQARKELDAARERFLDDRAVRAAHEETDERKRAARLAGIYAKQIHDGEGIGRIEIPAIDLDAVVVQGTDTADLQKGPGHYPTSALPGQGKTVAIAGHRTTYLAPFRDIASIAEDDEIVLELPYGTFSYRVIETDVVDPTDVGVVDDVGSERLVLTACHPLYSAAQRYVVTARLDDFELASG